MDILSAVILGVVQGLTEFLPISSSGHLIIVREFLGIQDAYGLSVDAVLHFATALAVLIYFWRDFLRLGNVALHTALKKPLSAESKHDQKLLFALIVGTIPAVIIGLLLESSIETLFRNTNLVAFALIVGSILFLIAEYISKRIEKEKGHTTTMSIKKGLLIGFFQSLALIPGMSRSGATISGGLILGLTRESAARFAFLLSFPIILGAGGLSAVRLTTAGLLPELGISLLVAASVAFITGLLAIHYLLKYLKTHTLGVFVVYRLLLAALLLFLL